MMESTRTSIYEAEMNNPPLVDAIKAAAEVSRLRAGSMLPQYPYRCPPLSWRPRRAIRDAPHTRTPIVRGPYG